MTGLQEILGYRLFSIGETPVNVVTVVTALGIATLTYLLARMAEKGTVRFLIRRGVRDEGSTGASARLVHYTVLAVGMAIAVEAMGINLRALFAAGAFLAIALGFAMQNITQNFVSGLILLVERSLKPGDIIEVEGRMVRVVRLGMRATVARTWDAEDLIIPNSTLVSSTVKNLTLRDRLHRIRTTVGVSYDSDMRRVREVLEAAAGGIEWRDRHTDPVILMKAFASSSVDFEVSVWVDDPWGRAVGLSNLNETVWHALKGEGIVIAYPQLDVHYKGDARELTAAPGGSA